ncbi:putative transmembrane protein [Apostichopus japonicus]|uniref:Transmembrane protein 231 n=1 Tax=Stichopus japonicus TaxID=307972 RepID=A0A2G8LCW5_STIJA|nr:putative transmembrane protein [Apostichopus japonicus]
MSNKPDPPVPLRLVRVDSKRFWIREAFYREQPSVVFKHGILLVLGMRDGSYVTWSTYSNFNLLEQSHLIIPVVKTREEDVNRDGKSDKLHFNLEVPVSDSQDVVSVEMILVFDYKLNVFAIFALLHTSYGVDAFIQRASFAAGAKFVAEGDLRLQLKQPLAHKGSDTRYNVAIIDENSVFVEDYTLSNIFSNYLSRNVSTYFDCKYPIWQTGRGAGQPFIITGSVSYPEELIIYPLRLDRRCLYIYLSNRTGNIPDA